MDNSEKLNILDIQRFSLHDGPGIRTTVFLKGCNLKCFWCHNPESIPSTPTELFFKERCIGCGKCKESSIMCPVGAKVIKGKLVEIEDIFEEVMKDKDYYGDSNGGVTFSGGEALLQADKLIKLLILCKEHNVHVAIDTAFMVSWGQIEKVIPYVDLFIVDIKQLDETKAKEAIGQSSGQLISNLQALDRQNIPIWIRLPLFEGFNTSKTHIKQVTDLVKSLESIKEIHLIPVLNHAQYKYKAMGLKFSPNHLRADTVDNINKWLVENGIGNEKIKILGK